MQMLTVGPSHIQTTHEESPQALNVLSQITFIYKITLLTKLVQLILASSQAYVGRFARNVWPVMDFHRALPVFPQHIICLSRCVSEIFLKLKQITKHQLNCNFPKKLPFSTVLLVCPLLETCIWKLLRAHQHMLMYNCSGLLVCTPQSFCNQKHWQWHTKTIGLHRYIVYILSTL